MVHLHRTARVAFPWLVLLVVAAAPPWLAWTFRRPPEVPEFDAPRPSPRFEITGAELDLPASRGAPASARAALVHWALLGEERLFSVRRGWVAEDVDLIDAAGRTRGHVERLSVTASSPGRYRWRGALNWDDPPTTLQGRGWIEVLDGELALDQ